MTYRDIAPRLFENGWRNVIPLTFDKGTRAKWKAVQHQQMTEKTLEFYIRNYGDAPRVGIVHGPVHGIVSIDVDIEDERASAEVRALMVKHLPEPGMVRIGKPPKFLAMYRGQVRSTRRTPIEVFGSSCQIAAFGIHPKTGKPYRWLENVSPLTMRPDELPPITQAQIDAFLNLCATEVVVRDSSGRKSPWTGWRELALERKIGGIDAAAKQLAEVQPRSRNNVLLSVTGYLVGELGCELEEVLEFTERWFPKHCRTEEYRNLRRVVTRMVNDAREKWEHSDWDLGDE